MSEIKLKPCPFCGGKAKFSTYDKGILDSASTIQVCCEQCNASSKLFVSNLYSCAAEDVAEVWNRRAENETD